MIEVLNDEVQKIEEDIDVHLTELLDDKIPMNKFIYHCNLVHIDLAIDHGVLFSVMEKHYLFSLKYNTYIAHKTLTEEDFFDYRFDEEVYTHAMEMFLKGVQYSILCDHFPLVHSNKAKMYKDKKGKICFKIKEIPRKNYKFFSDYTIKKALSYTLQMANGVLENDNFDDEEIALKLSSIYMEFWNENMLYEDFEPYSRVDWGGIAFFFVMASMRRFSKVYKNDFDIVKTDSQKMMILLSSKGVKGLREYVPDCTDELYNKALEDNIYKPLGRGFFPKLCISDAPLNVTKDGFIFTNPLVILFSNSCETRYLNYLRKTDKKRYSRTKDRIKERAIPLISEIVKLEFPDSIVISNFNVPIPKAKNQSRECDLLVVGKNGFAFYIEIKHFYYPKSFSEVKILDREFNKALDKMPQQIEAIKYGWSKLQEIYDFDIENKDIEGIISSHHYTGFDVEIDPKFPIVTYTDIYEGIVKAETMEDIYKICKSNDLIYPTIPLISKKQDFNFSNYVFEVELECLHPKFEIDFLKSYRKEVKNGLQIEESDNYKSVSELAKAYIEALNG